MSHLSQIIIPLFTFILGFLGNIALSKLHRNYEIKTLKKELELKIKEIVDIVNMLETLNGLASINNFLRLDGQICTEKPKNLFILNKKMAKDVIEFYDYLNKAITCDSSNDNFGLGTIIYLSLTKSHGEKILKKL